MSDTEPPKRITLRPLGFKAFAEPMGHSKGKRPEPKQEKLRTKRHQKDIENASS